MPINGVRLGRPAHQYYRDYRYYPDINGAAAIHPPLQLLCRHRRRRRVFEFHVLNNVAVASIIMIISITIVFLHLVFIIILLFVPAVGTGPLFLLDEWYVVDKRRKEIDQLTKDTQLVCCWTSGIFGHYFKNFASCPPQRMVRRQ